MSLRRFVLSCALAATLAAPALAEPRCVDLTLMPRHYFTNCDWSSDLSRMNGQETMASIVGLGGSPDSTMVYSLEGKYDMLETLVGYLDTAPDNRSAVFEVWADGVCLQKMGPLSSNDPPEKMRVPLKGRKTMTLRIVPQTYDSTHGAAFGDPKLWAELGNFVPGGVLMNVNGRTSQAVPNKVNGQEEVAIPVPLQPGAREYRVRVEYDPGMGKVRVETTEAPTSEAPPATR